MSFILNNLLKIKEHLMINKFKSIRIKIIIWFIIPTSIMLFISGLVAYKYIHNFTMSEIESAGINLTQARARELGQWVQSRLDELKTAADFISESSIDNLYLFIENYRNERIDIYESIFITDSFGNVTVGTDNPRDGLNLSHRKYYKDIFLDGASFSIGNPVKSEATGNLIVVIAFVINDLGNNSTGLLGAAVNLETLSQVSKQFSLFGKGFGWIVDGDGMVIAHPDENLRMKLNMTRAEEFGFTGLSNVGKKMLFGERGSFLKYRRPDESVSVLFWEPIPNTPFWTLGIAISENDLFQKIKIIPVYLTIFALIVLLLLFFISYYISYIINKPINELTKTVNKFRENSVNENFESMKLNNLLNSKDEIGSLTTAFKEMFFTIKSSTESLYLAQFSLDSAPDSIVWIGDEDKIEYVNNFLCLLTGYSKNELLKMKISDLDINFNNQLVQEKIQLLNQKGYSRLESNFRKKNGEIFPVEITVTKVIYKQYTLICAYIRDISERKQAETVLSNSEKKYRELTELLPQTVFETDITGKVTYVNKYGYEIFGYDRSDFEKGITVFDIISPPDHEVLKNNLHKLYTNQISIGNPYSAIRKDRSIIPVQIYSTVIKENNNIIGFRGIIVDMTERHSFEKKIKDNEENLKTILYSIGDGVIATDNNCNILRINSVAQKYTGWNEEEAIGKHLTDVLVLINPHTREKLKNPVEGVLSSGESCNKPNQSILISKNKKEYIVSESCAPIKSTDNNITGVVLVFRDITEEINLQNKLNHSQKMDAIGQLSGGIAHDFNNSLSGIIGAAELLKIKKFPEEKKETLINQILMAAERAGSLTKKLLTFSRKSSKVSSQVDIAKIVKDTIALLEHTIDKNIKISFVNNAKYSLIIGDDSLLQSAFMNIGINGSHAMPDGGDLSFIMSNLFLDEKYCEYSTFDIESGEYIEIAVRDTGTGMSLETITHIFEPFFTTKEHGKGTGLGLAAVYGTVQEHKGAVTVYSELGVGTVFHLYFPVTKTERNIFTTDEAELQGSGHVLIIDDEELIRITAQAMLESLGYDVSVAVNGKEGFELFKNSEIKINLIILDMIMPVMGGRETLEKIREIDKNIPVILSSGFTKEKDLEAIKKHNISFLDKPFRKADLATMVKQLI